MHTPPPLPPPPHTHPTHTQMAYHDKERYANADARRVGRLHTHLPGWRDANVAFMRRRAPELRSPLAPARLASCALTLPPTPQHHPPAPPSPPPCSCSGGYALSPRIPQVTQPTLVVWGRQDAILDPKASAHSLID